MKAWTVIDTYKDWTVERHYDKGNGCYDGKYRVRCGKKVFRQFLGCNGEENKENALHYFNNTVKALF